MYPGRLESTCFVRFVAHGAFGTRGSAVFSAVELNKAATPDAEASLGKGSYAHTGKVQCFRLPGEEPC